MKNLLYFFLFAFVGVLVFSCAKDQEGLIPKDSDIKLETRNASVWICHKPEGNNPHAIYVDASAVDAHLGHGDVLLDADGDGFTAANLCGEGSMDDCNDNDASINPGAEEVCGDGIDNNCDGQIDEDCIPVCCFNVAVEELNLTCWNGNPSSPILWDENVFYGLCSSCNGGVCSYRTPILGFYADGSPASEQCRLYLVQLAEDLGLGIGTNCSSNSLRQTEEVFGL